MNKQRILEMLLSECNGRGEKGKLSFLKGWMKRACGVW
jgi:hypothetical protein